MRSFVSRSSLITGGPRPTRRRGRHATRRWLFARSTRAAGLACAAAITFVGCGSTGVDPSSPAYKPGELGNGGFAFTCDDSVPCNKFNAASQFPNTVAQGASFRVRYVPSDSSKGGAGVSISPIGTAFLGNGPDGLVGLRVGVGTITARNAQGSLVEFTSIKIEKPDAIVVYDGEFVGSSNPVTIDRVSLRVGERRTLRALSRHGGHDLAGLLQYAWGSEAPAIAVVDGVTQGKATIVAKAAGTTTLTVEGGSYRQQIPLEVSQ